MTREPVWLVLEISERPNNWYRYHVSGINEHALGTMNEQFSWNVPSLDSRYQPHPNAPESVRSILFRAKEARP